MSFIPCPAGTLLIPSGHSGKHLFVVMTNECKAGQHLLFSISSIKNGVSYDAACEFLGGEHKFITKPSFVYYRFADYRRSDHIINLVNKKYFEPQDNLSAEHFSRICAGVENSKFIKPSVVKYFLANGPAI